MSNNLGLSQIAATQSNKHVTANDATGQLDAALSDRVDVALTGVASPLVLTDAQALRCMVLKLTGTHPGGAYEMHCPTNRKLYIVWNSAAGDVTFKTAAGTGVLVPAGGRTTAYGDGTNVELVASEGGGSSYDFGFSAGGTPTGSQVLGKVVVPRDVTVPANMAGAAGHVDANPTAPYVIDVTDDGSSIGTMTISTTGAFTFATVGGTAKSIAAGSVVRFVGAATPDATLSNPAATLQATED